MTKGSHDFTLEQADFFSALARRAIEVANSIVRDRDSIDTSDFADRGKSNFLGDDLDDEHLKRIEMLFSGESVSGSRFAEAQLRELAFWRWVAFEGYANYDPRLFPLHQEHLMVSTFYRTGWTRNEFLGSRVFELGCGPLGMIEYLPAAERVAYDPLNEHYQKLYWRCRDPRILHLSDRKQLLNMSAGYDLVICHNVIDHTDEPEWWFNTLFSKGKVGGRFILQLNVSDPSIKQSEDHRRMHPSPFLLNQIEEWVFAKSSDSRLFKSDRPSADGEYYVLAWGTITADRPVKYFNLLRQH